MQDLLPLTSPFQQPFSDQEEMPKKGSRLEGPLPSSSRISTDCPAVSIQIVRQSTIQFTVSELFEGHTVSKRFHMQ